MKIAIEAKLKHAAIYRAVFENYKSVKAFCRDKGIHYGTLNKMLNLKYKPGKQFAQKVSNILIEMGYCVMPEDLWDDRVSKLEKTKVLLSVDMKEAFIGINSPTASENRKYLLEEAIGNVLNDREKDIIESYYTGDGESIRSISGRLHRSPQRISQIRHGAIDKIKHYISTKEV